MKSDEQWECRIPHTTKMKACTGVGEKGGHLWPRNSQRVAVECKRSRELIRNLKATVTIAAEVCVLRVYIAHLFDFTAVVVPVGAVVFRLLFVLLAFIPS